MSIHTHFYCSVGNWIYIKIILELQRFFPSCSALDVHVSIIFNHLWESHVSEREDVVAQLKVSSALHLSNTSIVPVLLSHLPPSGPISPASLWSWLRPEDEHILMTYCGWESARHKSSAWWEMRTPLLLYASIPHKLSSILWKPLM